MKAIITVGISASGKTTWALSQENYVTISRDDIRFNYILDEYDWSKYKFSKDNENTVTEVQEFLIELYSTLGKNIIIADTNLNEFYRNKLKAKLESIGYEVDVKEFPISVEEAVKRDTCRHNMVGEDVIYRQFQKWNEYINEKTYKSS